MNTGLSASVPTRPHLSPIGKERIGEETTSQALRSVGGASSLVPTNGASKVYATAGQELAAFYRRDIQREYHEHLAVLEAQMATEFRFRKGELDAWRKRQIAELCEPMEGP